jgi:hypothetical protein
MDATETILTRLKTGETVEPRAWASSFAWYEVAKRRRAHARLTRRATQGAPHSRKGAQRASQVQPEQMAAVRDLLSAKEYVALAVRMSGMSYREGASALGISQAAFTGRVASAVDRADVVRDGCSRCGSPARFWRSPRSSEKRAWPIGTSEILDAFGLMRASRASARRELEVQLELDEHRDCVPVAARVRALARTRADGGADDERQALGGLAAACIRQAETLPAPRFADVRLRAARERAGIAA